MGRECVFDRGVEGDEFLTEEMSRRKLDDILSLGLQQGPADPSRILKGLWGSLARLQ